YHYYYNKKHGLRVRCDEIDPLIVSRVRTYFKGNEVFAKLVEQSLRRKEAELPKVESEILDTKRKLADVDATNSRLRQAMLDPERRDDPSFMPWLQDQVRVLSTQQRELSAGLEGLERHRERLTRNSGLENLDKAVKEFVAEFDRLTGV